VLYLQYTNPGSYPPLMHSARLLAEAGWDVLSLGTDTQSKTLTVPAHSRIRVSLMPFVDPGWRQKTHYARFAVWAVGQAWGYQPQWIYASDPLACPAALLVSALSGARVIYHEHDGPGEAPAPSRFMRGVLAARRRMAAHADLCVIPSAMRAELFQRAHPTARVMTVWNCPARREVSPPRQLRDHGLRVLYHGTIVPARLPLSIIDALAQLPAEVRLVVAGYETPGHVGYLEALRSRAATLGIADRFEFAGTLSRDAVMRHCATCDVGLGFLPRNSSDANERAMVGASNKVFDYMAAGLAVLVPDAPDWQATYVDRGFGLACNSESVDSLVAALSWMLTHPAERQAMGERGRRQVLEEWNYEQAFAPVMAHLGVIDRAAAAEGALSW